MTEIIQTGKDEKPWKTKTLKMATKANNEAASGYSNFSVYLNKRNNSGADIP